MLDGFGGRAIEIASDLSRNNAVEQEATEKTENECRAKTQLWYAESTH